MGFCFEADTMFRYSFKILPDRLKLIRLYLCRSALGQSISFVFGARIFVATPQSDVVGIWSRDLGVMATLSVRQKMPFLINNQAHKFSVCMTLHLKPVSHRVAVLSAKSCTQFMCLIINHFFSVTIMYYNSLQVNYMVIVFVR